MEDKGLVSVVTPSYNSAAYIAETIDSVCAQTYENWEMLIVDDCSTDHSVEIIEEYCRKDPRIHLLHNDKNSGAALSRNHALREAKGRWVAFLDSDDCWLPQKLEKQLDFMIEKSCHFSYTWYREYHEMDGSSDLLTGPLKISKAGMYGFCWVGCLTVMYERDYVGLIQVPDLKKRNDYAMWLLVIQKCPCYCLPECLAVYRRRDDSISSGSKFALLKHHYRLFHETLGFNPLNSWIMTFVNCVCWVYKRCHYKKPYETEDLL